MKTKRLGILSENSTPAFIVAGNDDLLTEILKRLPVVSLLRFKSVCKHWLSLITDPEFTRLLNPKLMHPSGFFIPWDDYEYDFMPFDGENLIKPPFRRIESPPYLSGTTFPILSSCNGLFCCGNVNPNNFSMYNFHIFNPSNKKYVRLPHPHIRARNYILAVNLVFDPSKSPTLYKVVCHVRISRSREPTRIRIHIYSSETGNWKPSVDFESDLLSTQIDNEVYFNGAIHWFSRRSSMRYFNVDQEQINVMPMHPVPHESVDRTCMYFGESSGHLHIIKTDGLNNLQLNVFDMERDYSGWCLRYKISLNEMVHTYPEMRPYPCFRYDVLYVYEDESMENSYMVLYIPGKIIRYSLVEKTWKLLFEYNPRSGLDYFSGVGDFKITIPFVASLSCWI